MNEGLTLSPGELEVEILSSMTVSMVEESSLSETNSLDVNYKDSLLSKPAKIQP